MESLSIGSLVIGAVLAFCASFVLGLVVLTVFRGVAGSSFGFFRKRGVSDVQLEAEESLAIYSAEVEGVRQKFNILSGYVTEYFNTFHAAGWDELQALLNDLQLAEDSLKLLLENRNYHEVKDISDFLLGKLPEDKIESLLQRYDGLEPLQNWRHESHEILLRIVRQSLESAQRTAAAGISRKRSSKPTLVTLAELRSALGDSSG
jgi:hypothetical protein